VVSSSVLATKSLNKKIELGSSNRSILLRPITMNAGISLISTILCNHSPSPSSCSGKCDTEYVHARLYVNQSKKRRKVTRSSHVQVIHSSSYTCPCAVRIRIFFHYPKYFFKGKRSSLRRNHQSLRHYKHIAQTMKETRASMLLLPRCKAAPSPVSVGRAPSPV
jgi:hypothetical protein